MPVEPLGLYIMMLLKWALFFPHMKLFMKACKFGRYELVRGIGSVRKWYKIVGSMDIFVTDALPAHEMCSLESSCD